MGTILFFYLPRIFRMFAVIFHLSVAKCFLCSSTISFKAYLMTPMNILPSHCWKSELRVDLDVTLGVEHLQLQFMIFQFCYLPQLNLFLTSMTSWWRDLFEMFWEKFIHLFIVILLRFSKKSFYLILCFCNVVYEVCFVGSLMNHWKWPTGLPNNIRFILIYTTISC